MIDQALVDLCIDTITLTAPSAPDSHGQIAHTGTGTDYLARVEGTIRVVRDLKGNVRTSMVTIYLPTTVAGLNPNYKITLPAAFTPASPSIIAIVLNGDEEGDHHTVIYC
jgi:hypothetical protein